MKFNEFIKKKGMTIKGFASISNIPASVLYNVHQGKNPSLEYAIKISDFSKQISFRDYISVQDLYNPKDIQKISNDKRRGRKKKNTIDTCPENNIAQNE